MSPYELFPENPDSACYLKKADHSMIVPSIVRGEECQEGDYVVAISNRLLKIPIKLGAVDELIETIERTEFPATCTDITPVSGTERMFHVPPADEVFPKNTAGDGNVEKGEANFGGKHIPIDAEPCAVCPRLVKANENAIAAHRKHHYINQFLHVDCLDEFTRGLKRVWDCDPELVAEIV